MKRIEDERILSEKKSIYSSAFGLCFLGLWAILLYRQFMLGQNLSEYIDIFLLTIGISIYVTINNVLKGLYLTYRSKYTRKKVNMVGAIIGSITFTFVKFFIRKPEFANISDFLEIIISVIVFFAVWVITQSFLFKLSDNKANEDIDS